MRRLAAKREGGDGGVIHGAVCAGPMFDDDESRREFMKVSFRTQFLSDFRFGYENKRSGKRIAPGKAL